MARVSETAKGLAAVVVGAAGVCALCSLGTLYLGAMTPILVVVPSLAAAAIAWIALGISCARPRFARGADVRLWLASAALLVGVLALGDGVLLQPSRRRSRRARPAPRCASRPPPLVSNGFQGTNLGFLYNPPEQQTVSLGDRLLGREIVRLEPLSGSWHLFATR